ncbi:MAG: LytTR family DNA-binding domain-containing protein [Bacteroidota bacterium]
MSTSTLIPCIVVDDEMMSLKAMERLAQQHPSLELLTTCKNGQEALAFLSQADQRVDLIFLDVEMPDMTGIELVKVLRPNQHVILVTSHPEYALEAFEINATDYLLKPVTPARFFQAVQKVQHLLVSTSSNEQTSSARPNEHLFVKEKGLLQRVNLSEIQWIEALGDYAQIHTPQKRYTINITMKGLVSKLPEGEFIRVHRSFIIRLDQLTTIEDNTLVVADKLIPVGKSYRKSLNEHLNLL